MFFSLCYYLVFSHSAIPLILSFDLPEMTGSVCFSYNYHNLQPYISETSN